VTLCPAIIDTNILVLDKVSFEQALLDCAHGLHLYMRGPAAKEPDHRHRRVLRARCERPSRRAAEQRDELASSHGFPQAESRTLLHLLALLTLAEWQTSTRLRPQIIRLQ
jgi:hypothetical protein